MVCMYEDIVEDPVVVEEIPTAADFGALKSAYTRRGRTVPTSLYVYQVLMRQACT